MKRILTITVVLFVLAALAYAAPSVMTDPKMRFWNQAGTAPLVGGKVYSYNAGTSTPKVTYKDSTGLIYNTNPVVLDSRGEANIWLDGCYKIILKDSTDVTQWTVDNVCSLSDWMEDVLSTQNEWLEQTDTPTYVAASQFSVSGDKRTTYQVGRRLKADTSGGTYYGYITASSYSAPNTTVTVMLDSGNFTGINTVYVGLLSTTNHSIAALPSEVKSGGFTVDGTEVNKTIIANFGSSGVITLGSGTSHAPGSRLRIVSAGSGSVTLAGVVSRGSYTIASPVLYQGDEADIVTESTTTAWRGLIYSATARTAMVPLASQTTQKLADDWLPGFTGYAVSSFTTTGVTEWTVPSDVSRVFVFASGGGAGGGGGDAPNVNGAGGGGQGAKVRWYQWQVTSAETYSVTVGAGGAGGTVGGGAGCAGTAGGTTTIVKTDGTGTIVSLGGGSGGYCVTASTGTGGNSGSVLYPGTPSSRTGTVVQSDYRETKWTDYAVSAQSGATGELGGDNGGNGGGYGGGIGSDGATDCGAGDANTGSGGGGGGSTAVAESSGCAGSDGYVTILYWYDTWP